MPLLTIRSRGTRIIATGFSPPPGSGVRARVSPRRGRDPGNEMTGGGSNQRPGKFSASAARTSDRQPDTGLVLASLRHRIGKDVELGQDGIEAHA